MLCELPRLPCPEQYLVQTCGVTLQVRQNQRRGQQGFTAQPIKIPGASELLPPAPCLSPSSFHHRDGKPKTEVPFLCPLLEHLAQGQGEKISQRTHRTTQRGDDTPGLGPIVSSAARSRENLLVPACPLSTLHMKGHGQEKSLKEQGNHNDSNVQFVNEILTTGLS